MYKIHPLTRLRKAIWIGKAGFGDGVTANEGMRLITTHLRPPSVLATNETGTDFSRVWPAREGAIRNADCP